MRLIDADKFIEDLGLDEENAREDNIGEIVTLEDFDRQETAYDADKVIEKLKKNEEDAIKSIMEYGKTEFHLIKITDLKELFEAYTKEQIEIVKSGGGADD